MLQKVLKAAIAAAVVTLVVAAGMSCATSKTISFYCAEQFVEIYINGEYAGEGLVHYQCSGKQKNITVSCRYEGQEIYSRTYYVKSSDGQMIELQISKNYFYSIEKH